MCGRHSDTGDTVTATQVTQRSDTCPQRGAQQPLRLDSERLRPNTDSQVHIRSAQHVAAAAAHSG
eukprot:4039350-Alexandrium_andersonii.AAC.1